MKKEIAEKWVAALRSGKYRQGTGRLCRRTVYGNECYCCLGVLTQILKPDNLVFFSSSGESDKVYLSDKDLKLFNQEVDESGYLVPNEFLSDGPMETEFLPKEIRKLAGIRSIQGDFYLDEIKEDNSDEYRLINKYVSLIEMNDKNISFQDIADAIEKYWRYL